MEKFVIRRIVDFSEKTQNFRNLAQFIILKVSKYVISRV